MLRDDEWQIKGDLVLKEGKIYVPRDEKLRVEIMAAPQCASSWT